MKVLFDDPNIRVAYYPLDKVLVATRKASDASAAEIVESMSRALQVDLSEYGQFAIILDVRAVVGRSDPDFERATGVLRAAVSERATRFVTLVATVAGALQTRRLASESGQSILVASTEDEAFRLARGGR